VISLTSGQKKIDLLRNALFPVVPSRSEPFANLILEGLASGLPVVASDVDGNKEMIIQNQNGALCRPLDVRHTRYGLTTVLAG